MARISEQIIEQIRSTADILEVVSGYVDLKKRGRNYFGLCPFHGEKTPSFSVNPQREIYKCFGCGAGGGSINFIMAIENLGFVDAVKQLADQYGIDLQLEETPGRSQDLISQLFDIHEKTAIYYLKNLGKDDGLEVLQHLEERGLSRDTIKKFKLGYSSNQKDVLLKLFRASGIGGEALKQSGLFIDTKNGYMDRFRSRIMFSIFNASGKVSAFAGRVYNSDDPAKYVNSPETPIYFKSKILYGLHESKTAIRNAGSAIVVEGYFDFLQLYQGGIENIVAVSGTAFTDDHALQLKRFCNEVSLAYDGDKAGIAAAIRAGYVLLRAGITPKIVSIPQGLDPDDWVKEQGPAPFLEAVENAMQLLPFHFQHYTGDLESNAGKSAFIHEVILELVQMKDPVFRELNARSLSEIIGVSADSIFHTLQSSLNRQKRQAEFRQQAESTNQFQTEKNQLLENDLLRLCFVKDEKIRQYLFEFVNLEWFTSTQSQDIFEKVYIHLHSDNTPQAGVVMDELKEDKDRRLLADLLFDLDNFNATMENAQECVLRMEKNWISNQIDALREELRNSESTGNDPLPVMKKIESFQSRKKNLSYHVLNE
ncbi:MAG: DNA primase [Candidatus Marinimicrobia bacterium]|jgi:DNA primase|nr:DNA primase [Candidatus Neomarinimicrobiota bacterium]MDP6852806.1 DNA primase [Candidatus Neomarinimicrobiota bacterium]